MQALTRPPERNRGADAVLDQATGIVMAFGRLRADQSDGPDGRYRAPPHRAGPDRDSLASWGSRGELNLRIRVAREEAIRAAHRTARRTVSAAE